MMEIKGLGDGKDDWRWMQSMDIQYSWHL